MQLPVTVHINVFRNTVQYHISYMFFNYSCFTQIKQTCYSIKRMMLFQLTELNHIQIYFYFKLS